MPFTGGYNDVNPESGEGVSGVDECSHGTQHMNVGSSNNHLY